MSDNTKTDWDDEIAEMEASIRNRTIILFDLKNKRANYLCPCAVGDIIKTKQGRTQQYEAVITRVTYLGYGNKWKALGRRIRKDGTLGVDSSILHEYKWDFVSIGKYKIDDKGAY